MGLESLERVMINLSDLKKVLAPALVSALGFLAWTAPAEAGWRDRWGWDDGFRRTVVVERVVRRPVVRRVVIVERPVVYRRVVHRPIVRRVLVERPVVYRRVVHRPIVRRVIVERPFYRHAGFRYGWHHRPWWGGGRWRERSQCWLPERYLCR